MRQTKKVKTTGYNEETFEGRLRYVLMNVERATGKVQLTLVWNAADYQAATPQLQLLVKELRRAAPDLFHSIWANFHEARTNTIVSRSPYSWHRCHGPEFVKEVIGVPQEEGAAPIAFSFSPPLFRQGNLDQFEQIVATVNRWVPEGSTVCELYAGVGVLGFNVLQKAEWVRCSDVNPANERAFERVQERTAKTLRSKITYQV